MINRKLARKSLVASQQVSKGEKFSELNLTTKRPGTRLSADQYINFIGKIANRNYKKDEFIKK